MFRKVDDARFWDRAARKYAADPIKDMAGYERTLKRTAELMKSHETWVEIGCGTGMSARRLAPHINHLVATDVSADMIAIAREKALVEACRNVEFHVATPEHVPAVSSAFDGTLAFNVLHLLPDRATALGRVRGLLKPGGLFVSKTPCLAEMNRLIRFAVPIAQAIGKAPTVAFFDAAQLEQDIVRAGFEILERARHGSSGKDPRIFLVARREA